MNYLRTRQSVQASEGICGVPLDTYGYDARSIRQRPTNQRKSSIPCFSNGVVTLLYCTVARECFASMVIHLHWQNRLGMHPNFEISLPKRGVLNPLLQSDEIVYIGLSTGGACLHAQSVSTTNVDTTLSVPAIPPQSCATAFCKCDSLVWVFKQTVLGFFCARCFISDSLAFVIRNAGREHWCVAVVQVHSLAIVPGVYQRTQRSKRHLSSLFASNAPPPTALKERLKS